MIDPFDQGNAASELADCAKYADMSRDELVVAGLMEAEWYQDFNPGCDCYPEDSEDRR